ncbi:MAG: tRNA(Ile)(2)-agmatinylcytidine synthase [Thaumarchaeota archaeon]|nr:tRNA(Ile)(2)-agmatinylcytidine synthase [Nitrososphaerota archaeon]
MGRAVLRVGIDDTDSRLGMCTTYLGYRIAVAMRARGDEIAPYPRLIRLNPNVPWRTRGNGAVGITVLTRDAVGARREIEEMVRRHSETANGANPGLAFLESGSVPDALSEFAREALWRVIPRERAARLAGTLGLECHSLGNGQGLVGALGAIGYRLGDFTMELLAYRSEGLVGTPRRIEAESVRELHERTFPSTFNSYDAARGRALIAPHGPDPVLYGIRGEDARSVIDASAHVRGERPAGHMVFATNQGTGDHLAHALDAGALRAHEAGTIEGEVAAAPKVISGGHVRLTVGCGSARAACLVYHATGMGALARSLVRGDAVRLGGGVARAAHGPSLNVETIEVLRAARLWREASPMCAPCRKRMKSAGAGQGYRCVRCGASSPRRAVEEVARAVRAGGHVALPSAQRHLSRPAHRRAGRRAQPRRLEGGWIL